VQVQLFPAGPGRPRLVIDASDYGDRYTPYAVGGRWDRHPLLEAAVEHVPLPLDCCAEVSIACDVPAGASTGTSAAVSVALVAALDLARGGRLSRRDIARAAHAVETERLGQQSGIQDQICSAMGGINLIEMSAYPQAEVRQLALDDRVRWELERRLALVFLGRGHSSSDIHARVIARIAGAGPDCPELQQLRRAARAACDALSAGSFDGLGRAMCENTDAQRLLHPELVCEDADRVIAIARDHGAAGWKVNGAGGDGGSLTVLAPASTGAARAMRRAIASSLPHARVIPIALDGEGLRVWRTA